MTGKREMGDYQTPPVFADRVCEYLRVKKSIKPSVVIDPTCGIGNFLHSSLSFGADRYFGIEINKDYCLQCNNRFKNLPVTILNRDFFHFEIKKLAIGAKNVLFIGNPPWVTNSDLSAIKSSNLPTKANIKQMRGIDAMTGASNFDICESIILHIIEKFRDMNAVLAMLCKTSVARNVFAQMKCTDVRFDYCDMIEFDAKKEFGVDVSACLFVTKLTRLGTGNICDIRHFNDDIVTSLSYECGHIVNNTGSKTDLIGECCFEWRQGIKHDCATVMNLDNNGGILRNGRGETVDIEGDYLYPLVKGSMIKSPVITSSNKCVIVTQYRTGEDTSNIERLAPKTWHYLLANARLLDGRKSIVYRNNPPFSMFGVGKYSYAPFKVAVSGFYKRPLFSCIQPCNNRPMMIDDTCYFIPFDNFPHAYTAMLLLNSKVVQDFLAGEVFLDAKRPYTKGILRRLSFNKILALTSFKDISQTEMLLCLPVKITERMYESFKSAVLFGRGLLLF